MTRLHLTLPLVIALAACAKRGADAPADAEPVIAEPAPAPDGLPAWDDVPSGHPPGATDPPFPVLIISPDGVCHKRWQSPFLRRSGVVFDPHVEDCVGTDLGCGTAVTCPASAAPLLETLTASGAAPQGR